MPHIEDALHDRFRPANPGNMPIQIGRIFEVDRTKHTVSVALRRGGLLKNVQVAKDVIGTSEGSGWLPNVDQGRGSIPTFMGTQEHDTYAVIGYLDGDYRYPVVLGLLPPTGFETAFPDYEVNKLHNGMWYVVDDDGFEISRPDGTFIRIGASNEQVDVEELNADKRHSFLKDGTSNTVPSIMISHSSGTSIEITPAGAIIITKAGGGSFNLGTHQHTETGTTTGGPI